MSILSVFLTAVLPIIVLTVVGFVLGWTRNLDVTPLNTVAIYVLAPALVFHSLTTTPIGGRVAVNIFLGVGAFIGSMALIAALVSRMTATSGPSVSAIVLASAFPNTGNYGIPLSDFAFGAVGRSAAVLFLVVQSVYTFTLGVYVASYGGRANYRAALESIVKLPLVYAVFAAAIMLWLDAVPPTDGTAMQTIKLVGDAMIPIMLLLLGIQLANTNYGAAISHVGTANVLKLAIAPVIGLGIALVLGLPDDTIARVFVLQCGMPAAVTTLILSLEFTGDRSASGTISDPEFLGAAIFTSTLLSIPVLTVLITLLQSGVII